MVGGIAFNTFPEVWLQIGADGWTKDAIEAVKMAKRWLKKNPF